MIWFVHQAIHVEGHGYSCTPDRIGQLLWPFFEADPKAGRIDDAGTPLASSVAASAGCEQHGPTAVLNSVCRLNSGQSWQCGYQVNISFHAGMIADPSRRKSSARC